MSSINRKLLYMAIILTIIFGGGAVAYGSPSFSFAGWIKYNLAFIFILTVIYKSLNGWLFRPFIQLSGKSRGLAAIVYMIYSAAFWYSLQGSQTTQSESNIYLLIQLSAFIMVFLVVLFFIRIFLNYEVGPERISLTKWKILVYSLPTMVIWLLYLMAYYPAVMTPDSLDQWNQIQLRQFNDWHPVVHTWLMMAVSFLWNSPAAVASMQILVLSLIFGYMAYTFMKQGVHRSLVYLIIAINAFLPINGIYSVTLWKDILYSGMLCALTLLLYNILYSNGRWLSKYSNLALFFIVSLGMILLRHNGLPVFLGTIGVIGLFMRKKHIKLYLVSAMVVLVSLVITGPIYHLAKVSPSSPSEKYAIPIQQISAVIRSGGDITEEQLSFVSNILPLDLWKTTNSPYNVDPIKFHKEFNRDLLNRNGGLFVKHWANIVLQNPTIAIQSYFKQTSLVWQVVPFDDGYVNAYATEIYPKEQAASMGIHQKPVSPVLTEKFTKMLNTTMERPFALMWRPALYLFLIILCVFFAWLIGNRKLSLVALPALLNSAIVAAALPAQDFRYLYANVLIANVILLAVLATKNKGISNESGLGEKNDS